MRAYGARQPRVDDSAWRPPDLSDEQRNALGRKSDAEDDEIDVDWSLLNDEPQAVEEEEEEVDVNNKDTI